MGKMLNIRLLGDFRLHYGGEEVTTINSGRLRSLLGNLILRRNTPQSRHRLAFLFWPDSTESQALTNLRNLIHRLRRSLPDADRFLLADGETIQWRPDAPFVLDVADFEDAITQSNRESQVGNLIAARKSLEEAVALYRGELLPGCYDDWIWTERERLRQKFADSLEQLMLILEGAGDYHIAVKYARLMIRHEPLREASYRHLMRLYALSGEKASALRTYQKCAKILQREMSLDPGPATQKLYRIILKSRTPEEIRAAARQVPVTHIFDSQRHNLPFQPTPFVGRKKEKDEVLDRIRDPSCRILTLVGPGGIGKTRLAVQAAKEMLDVYSGGVFFVPLASVDSVEFIVPTIADAIGLGLYTYGDPKQQILNYLREKHLLLVLDSFEHLIKGAGLLAEIIAAAPRVQLLITSRERLNLQGEWVYEVGGLDYPLGEKYGQIQRYSAVQLFLQSARRLYPGFSLSETEKPFVARICQLVEGMPLGIEMASAWVPVLDCREIAREIEENLDFLEMPLQDVPERHRSMRAVFQHSWNLLTDEERLAFRRMSVFRGSFCRDAAGAVANASLPVLSSLVGKSLLYRTPSGRYEIHQLLRQCGEEKLEKDSREGDQTHERHSRYYAEFLQVRADQLKGAGQEEALEEIEEEIGNIRAAWEWAVEHKDLVKIGEMLESLWLFYEMKGRSAEGEETFGMAAAELRSAERKTGSEGATLGQVLARQGWFRFRLSLFSTARELLQESIAILRPLDLKKEMAFSLGALAVVAYVQGEYDEAEQLQRQSLNICRNIGDRFCIARALNSLGFVANAVGRYEEASNLLREAIDVFEKAGNRWGVAFCLNNLGNSLYYLGEYAQAKESFQRSLDIRETLNDRWGVPRSLDGLGRVACAMGDYTEARKFYLKSLEIFRDSGDRRSTAYALFHLGDLSFLTEDYAKAERLYRESLAIRREVGDRRGAVRSLIGLGEVARKLGRYQDAEDYFLAGLEKASEIEAPPLILEANLGIAEILADQGDAERSQAIVEEILNHPARSKMTERKATALLQTRK